VGEALACPGLGLVPVPGGEVFVKTRHRRRGGRKTHGRAIPGCGGRHVF
jgi:hypothetical protein